MDPITAVAQMVTAVCALVAKAMDGQTPEQKAQIWAWFIEDQARWRKFFKIPD